MSATGVSFRRAPLAGVVALLLLAAGALPAGATRSYPAPASGAHAPFVPGEVIVKYRPGIASSSARAAARASVGGSLERRLRSGAADLLRLPAGASVEQAVASLERRGDVEYAQPNYRYAPALAPNDPQFEDQWGMQNDEQEFCFAPDDCKVGTAGADANAASAWDTATGDGSPIVAVIDSGIDADHPDLEDNLWSNPDETADGTDEDGNGKVDDVNGWNFVSDTTNIEDEHNHGTHVAGIIGAAGNNGQGVAGVIWDVQIMVLRVFEGASNGTGGTSDQLADAIDYARENGANIVNMSLGSRNDTDQFVLDAIVDSPDMLFVVAAGNGDDDGLGDDVDGVDPNPDETDGPGMITPCGLTPEDEPGGADNLICVAATDNQDAITGFSNFGATSVDLGAPGEFIKSTIRAGGYDFLQGTSMATPHVAGAAALVLSEAPSLNAELLKDRILDNVEPNASLAGKTATEGRLDIAAAVATVPGIGIAETDGGTAIDEGIMADTYTIFLNTAPASDVTVDLGFTAGEFTVDQDPVVLDAGNFAGVVVTVTPVDDADFDPGEAEITHTVTSADADYHERAVRSITVEMGPDIADDPSPPTGMAVTGTIWKSPFLSSRSLPFGWTATDAETGVSGYNVLVTGTRYDRKAIPFTHPIPSASDYTAATSVTLGLTSGLRGYTLCAKVRARDLKPNTSAFGSAKCAGVPLDDRELARSSGWASVSSNAFYEKTATKTTTKNAKLTRTGLSKVVKISLLVRRCPTCGSVDVLLGSTLLKRLSLASSKTQDKVLLAVTTSGARSGTLTIKVITSGKLVQIDGLGLRTS